MNIRRLLPVLLLVTTTVVATTSAQAQFTTTVGATTLSSNTAFSLLNAGSNTNSSSAYVSVGAISVSPIYLGSLYPLDKKWHIRFGVPFLIAWDYAYLRSHMVAAYEENPDIYNSRSAEFREAVDILGWADFVPPSAWAPIRCELQFRFVPPELKFGATRRIETGLLPVKGTGTFWIR